MKKITTSLTVDADVVTRARTIIETSGLPFSASKLISTLVFEVFDRIESTTPGLQMPLVEKLRRSIHGETTVQQNIDETVALATRRVDSDLEATIRRIMQQELAAREPKPTKRKAS